MKNVFAPLATSVLVPLELAAVASPTVAAIQKKIFGSEATLIIPDEEMNNIMEMVKSVKGSGLLMKVVSETIKNEVKEQKSSFLGMLLGTLGASLLGNTRFFIRKPIFCQTSIFFNIRLAIRLGFS